MLRSDALNESIIRAMRQVGEGTKVYPIFCDKYYMVRQRRSAEQKGTQAQEPDSLYIDDLGELSKLAADKKEESRWAALPPDESWGYLAALS